MPRAVVILIHGTFATGAKWTKSGSLVRRRLKERLGAETLFRPFYWSGKNSHRSRQQAGAMLAHLLEKHAEEERDVVRFLVAHSHGGNVALYALRDEKTRKLVHGLASFNTPYILCNRRPTREYLLVPAALVALLLSGAIVVAEVESNEFGEPSLGSLVALNVVWGLLVGLAKWLAKHAKNRQNRILEYVSLPTTKNLDLYCAVDQGDVIGFWLRLVERISSLGHKLWKTWVFVAVGVLGFTATLSFAWIEPRADVPIWYVLLRGAVAGLATVVMFIAGIQMLMLVLPRVFRSHCLGFGWEAIGTNWLVEIKADNLPPEYPCTVRHKHNIDSSLRHDLYADDGCVTAVAEELARIVAAGSAP